MSEQRVDKKVGAHPITCACVREAPDGFWIGNVALCNCGAFERVLAAAAQPVSSEQVEKHDQELGEGGNCTEAASVDTNKDIQAVVAKLLFLDKEALRLAEARRPDAYYFGPYRTFEKGKDKDSLLKFPFVNEVELIPAEEVTQLLAEHNALRERCNIEWAKRREAEQECERLRATQPAASVSELSTTTPDQGSLPHEPESESPSVSPDTVADFEAEARARDLAQIIVTESSQDAHYVDSTWLDGLFKHHLTERITKALLASAYTRGRQAGVDREAVEVAAREIVGKTKCDEYHGGPQRTVMAADAVAAIITKHLEGGGNKT
jgi:hypothetical protein